MTLVMVVLTIAVVAGVVAVAVGVVPGGLAEPAASIPARALPHQEPTGQDITELRFVQAFRGYRMDQVDAAMDALAIEIDRLRGLLETGNRPPEELDQRSESLAPNPTPLQNPAQNPTQTQNPAQNLAQAPDEQLAWPGAWKAERD